MALNRGWGLFGRGWRIFTGGVVHWILALILFFVISIVLNLIPLIGGLVLAVITPALIAGFLKLAHEIESGREGAVAHLFAPLRDPERRNPLLILGLLALVASLVLGVVAAAFVGGTIMLDETSGMGTGMMPLAGVGFFGLIVLFLLYLAIFAALAFAIPLVYFRGVPIGDAVLASIQGTITNLAPLIIFSVIYFVLAIIAMIPFGLGFLILGPVVLGAVYGAYREIFPEPEVEVVHGEAS
ncbi:putative transmembrane protein [Thioalkalivibrio nitratireducens DSM 14787]|uniref:Transmembrane protein n=2 Tax=Thioalkalivibrio nitratireducens TaxID=186931 RepID=L0DQM1_THIND|nr:putative transmembrane protein [Thioalkalivibrio nitratireducens DSM 14787]